MTKELFKRILSTIFLIPLVFFFIAKGSFYFNFFIFLCFVITLYEWYQMNTKKDSFIYGTIFLVFSFYTVYNLRNDGDLNFFLLIVITCIATDIGGYIFGKTFKGPKLTNISPNKTYAGMFGSFFLSIISMNFFFNNFSRLDLGLNIEITKQLIIIVLLTSLVSQIGDLIVSFFKRKSKIKNTGILIPGHGGLLDRIDGMIFAFPFVFLLSKFFL
jgi:phosphatidate cytidylyltransferase